MVYISVIAIVLGFGLFAMLAYWFYRPYNIIDYPNEPMPVGKEVYEHGEQIDYYIEWCKFREFPARVEFKLVQPMESGSRTAYILSQYVSSTVGTGCGSSNSLSPQIPQYIPPGEYKLMFEVSYRVNPVRTVNETTSSQFFTIK